MALPPDWREVALASVAEVRLGRQRSPKNHAGDQMRPYVRAANVTWSGLQLDEVKEMNFTDPEMETFRLKPGDLLLGEASGSPGEVGKPAIWRGEIANCAFQNTLVRVRPLGPDPEYLLHYFRHQAISGRFAAAARGVGIHHLGSDALAKWRLPLPPLSEQRRIAEVLDRADGVRAKRRKALALLADLTQSIFLDLFGPTSDPRQWSTSTLGELLAGIDSGTSPVCLSRPATDAEWGVLKLGAVSRRRYLPEQNKALPEGVEPAVEDEVKSGDLLMARKNTLDLVGACALVRTTPPRLLLPDLIFRLRLKDQLSVQKRYLHAALGQDEVRGQIRSLAGGSAGSMPNISKARLSTIRLRIPPMELQDAFDAQLDLVEEQNAMGSLHLDQFDILFASLQQRAFVGEL